MALLGKLGFEMERAALGGRTDIMNDAEIRRRPEAVESIVSDTEAMAFSMISETKVGALLAALAASKPAGRLLELGTGTGHGTAWLLAGMDAASTLDTVDADERVVAVAQRHLGADGRVRFHVMDGSEFLRGTTPRQFDLIYADAWPGKFSHLDDALGLLRRGGSMSSTICCRRRTGQKATRPRYLRSSTTSRVTTSSRP